MSLAVEAAGAPEGVGEEEWRCGGGEGEEPEGEEEDAVVAEGGGAGGVGEAGEVAVGVEAGVAHVGARVGRGLGAVAGVGGDREGGGGGDALDEDLEVAGVGDDGAGVVVGVEPDAVGVVVAARPEDQTGYEEREGE